MVTFSLDEDINKSLPDVELAVLDILRQVSNFEVYMQIKTLNEKKSMSKIVS